MTRIRFGQENFNFSLIFSFNVHEYTVQVLDFFIRFSSDVYPICPRYSWRMAISYEHHCVNHNLIFRKMRC